MEHKDHARRRPQEKPWLWALGFVILLSVGLLGWMAWSMRVGVQEGHAEKGAWRDANGKLHVLGVILGETTLREAERRLRSRSDVALFIYPQGHPRAGMKLEASFPSIADHTKVFLWLDASQAALHDMERRATAPHLYPNGVARMNLAPADRQHALAFPVRELTLIPSARLNETDVLRRFGSPDRAFVGKDGRKVFLFSDLGLRLVLGPDHVAMLRFSP